MANRRIVPRVSAASPGSDCSPRHGTRQMEIKHGRSITPVFVVFLSPCGERGSVRQTLQTGSQRTLPQEAPRQNNCRAFFFFFFPQANRHACAAGLLSPVAVHLSAACASDKEEEFWPLQLLTGGGNESFRLFDPIGKLNLSAAN